MGSGETKSSTGYGSPPWIFKGSALYQLHLVKAETARAFIPKELRLVEAFGYSYFYLVTLWGFIMGVYCVFFSPPINQQHAQCRYTLGGFFLANYDHSPAGVFDELVVIAGIVWNPPTSCAWAARVLVNSEEACHHGRKDVGLPSQVARFSKRITPVPRQTKDRIGGFLNMIGVSTTSCHSKDCMDVQVTEVLGPTPLDICNIKLITDVPSPKLNKWMGPSIRMSLPSFSGQTEYNPNLLKYACRLACRVRAVRPAKISGPSPLKNERNSDSERREFTAEEAADNGRNLSISVMLSKPILALEFNCLEMQVEAPIIPSNNSTSSLPGA
ncbi:protein NEOXANTHIN-DEFICIENT 1-like isoform X2 [Hibiscus syriacus]|uniref:protein NEOXANTHIN-DEFICIENT 1-like isoform X2 n=1 Tax=Hibiscus syriacus TaxID=106335 RepID=UPI001921AF6D|nr:protein NEOXANTHIN-DEFICIENT 1-like isoform X2 [Hibiscus syriacus]